MGSRSPLVDIEVHRVRAKRNPSPLCLPLQSCSWDISFAREQILRFFKEDGQLARTFWLFVPLVKELLLCCHTNFIEDLGREGGYHPITPVHFNIQWLWSSCQCEALVVVLFFIFIYFFCLFWLSRLFLEDFELSSVFADFLLASAQADHSPSFLS